MHLQWDYSDGGFGSKLNPVEDQQQILYLQLAPWSWEKKEVYFLPKLYDHFSSKGN
jgi:hypothetical protein